MLFNVYNFPLKVYNWAKFSIYNSLPYFDLTLSGFFELVIYQKKIFYQACIQVILCEKFLLNPVRYKQCRSIFKALLFM